jgi:NAD(P)H-flavin reductase
MDCQTFASNNLSKGSVIRVSVVLRKKLTVRAGQYFYLTVPALGYFGILQAHPYVVAWSSVDENKHALVHFLIQSRQGFSKRVRSIGPHTAAILHGPYGGGISMVEFDKVLILANGIGIASQLLHVRELLKAHNSREARVRRISIAWVVEHESESHLRHMSDNLANQIAKTNMNGWRNSFKRCLNWINARYSMSTFTLLDTQRTIL